MPSEPSLDEQIGAVELRLIDREAALRRRLHEVGPRLQAALRPTRFVAPVLLVTVAAALIGRLRALLRGPRRAAPFVQQAAQGPAPRATASGWLALLPWAALVELAWPMLPPHWRSRVSASTAATLLRVAAPLLGQLLQRRDAVEVERSEP